jgi:hypothetical protein
VEITYFTGLNKKHFDWKLDQQPKKGKLDQLAAWWSESSSLLADCDL